MARVAGLAGRGRIGIALVRAAALLGGKEWDRKKGIDSLWCKVSGSLN